MITTDSEVLSITSGYIFPFNQTWHSLFVEIGQPQSSNRLHPYTYLTTDRVASRPCLVCTG